MTAGRRAAVLLLALAPALLFAAAAAARQQQAVCPDPPGNPAAGNRVECTEKADSTGKIVIRLKDFDIDATGRNIRGVSAWHEGNGGIDIRIGGGEIETDGLYGRGVFAEPKGGGRVAIGADGARIETKDDYSQGVFGVALGAGDLDIDIRDSAILTDGVNSYAVEGLHKGEDALRIRIRGGRLETKSHRAQAVYARRSGTGLLRIETRDADIVTRGLVSPPGDPLNLGDGRSHGIMGWILAGSGGIEIDVKGGSIATGGSQSVGVYGWHQGAGGIDIGVRGAGIDTAGAGAYGILGSHTGASGDIAIALAGGAEVTTAGDRAHGLYTRITGSGAVSAEVGAGSSVRATGADASGIRFGRFNATTMALERAADKDDDGFRRQAATVDGTVMGGAGDAAGVYLAGGGKVFIGPQGTVGAKSGVAVWARRKLDTGDNAENPPALYVGLDPGGRTAAEIIGGGWILNDGGVTTVVVNGVVLHDADGATGLWAPDGARRVTIRKAGVTVAIPASGPWTVSDPSDSTVADRDFSAADFIYGGYGAHAAVYEALPGFLLRLDGGWMAAGALDGLSGPGRAQAVASADGASGAGGRARTPGSPLWLRVGGGFGSYRAQQADAGARYRFRRWEAEAGMDFPLAEGVTGFVSARLASGSAKVASQPAAGASRRPATASPPGPSGAARTGLSPPGAFPPCATAWTWTWLRTWRRRGRWRRARAHGRSATGRRRGGASPPARPGSPGGSGSTARRRRSAALPTRRRRGFRRWAGAGWTPGRGSPQRPCGRWAAADWRCAARWKSGSRSGRKRRRPSPARPCVRKRRARACCSAWARNGGPGRTTAEPRSASTRRPAGPARRTPPTASTLPCARRSDRPRGAFPAGLAPLPQGIPLQNADKSETAAGAAFPSRHFDRRPGPPGRGGVACPFGFAQGRL